MKKIMPNIIILGSSRSGKTTLANKLCKKLGYNLISIDAIVSAFQRGIPELGINHDDRTGESVKKLNPFILEYICSLNSFYQRVRGLNYVIEGSYMNLESLKENIPMEKFVLIVLVRKGLTKQDFYKSFKKHDKNWDWTNDLNKKELLNYCENLVISNKEIIESCKKNNANYYNVAENRGKCFREVVKKTSKEIKEKEKKLKDYGL